MKSLYEDDNLRVDFDEDDQELVVVAKQSANEDNILYIMSNAAGELTLVAPASKWHFEKISGYTGFRFGLNLD